MIQTYEFTVKDYQRMSDESLGWLCWGKPEAFYVQDIKLKNNNSFYEFLKSEGFTRSHDHSHEFCCGLYISVRRKLFSPPPPGIKLMDCVGGHCITLDEFMTIYNIYKKCEGRPWYKY